MLLCIHRAEAEGADAGDKPWEGPLPAEALKELGLAKGAVHRMTSQAWWCEALFPACCAGPELKFTNTAACSRNSTSDVQKGCWQLLMRRCRAI